MVFSLSSSSKLGYQSPINQLSSHNHSHREAKARHTMVSHRKFIAWHLYAGLTIRNRIFLPCRSIELCSRVLNHGGLCSKSVSSLFLSIYFWYIFGLMLTGISFFSAVFHINSHHNIIPSKDIPFSRHRTQNIVWQYWNDLKNFVLLFILLIVQ